MTFIVGWAGDAPTFLKENEIRPAALVQTYFDLGAQDTKEFFADAPREPTDCPSCDSEGELAFEKLGFSYPCVSAMLVPLGGRTPLLGQGDMTPVCGPGSR